MQISSRWTMAHKVKVLELAEVKSCLQANILAVKQTFIHNKIKVLKLLRKK